MSRYLSQMIKAEWKEREFSESFIVAQRPTNTLHTHKRIRDAPRGSFFQDFSPLCFCFTLQPWNWNSVNMNKELRSAYWTPIHLYKLDLSHRLDVAVCVCFQLSSVFEKLRIMGTDRIGFSLIYSCANIYQSRTVCMLMRVIEPFVRVVLMKPQVCFRKYLGFYCHLELNFIQGHPGSVFQSFPSPDPWREKLHSNCSWRDKTEQEGIQSHTTPPY